MALKRDLSLFDLTNIVVGTIVILAGILIYLYFSPKVDMAELKEDFLSEPMVARRYLEKTDRFLARVLRMVKRILDHLSARY